MSQTDQAHQTDAQPTSSISFSSVYTFSHVFPPNTDQSTFFLRTTLPLIKDALEGQNGLFFAYGVTNSGKTYTMQGGNTDGSAGILPRTLDVIFNSIEGLHGNGKVCFLGKCTMSS
jgi:kinesin family member 20